VELHGGSISARSAGLGHGAEFTVRLPAIRGSVPDAAAPAPAPLAPPGRGRRILLVDDNQDTLRLLSRLLMRRSHEVCTVADGLAALQIAQEFQPEVLLLDIGLPGLDGYSLARRLRANGFADALMIAISGYAQESDRVLAHEAGFDRHFAKPVDFDELAALLVTEPARPTA
jgi:CheY-like chemotaxis protein